LTPAAILDRYSALATRVDPVPPAAPASRDVDDDHVLACALAAHADLIVSGDGDLLSLQSFQRIPIIAAAQAIGIIQHKMRQPRKADR